MKIKNHKLENTKYVPSPNVSGNINPKFIVQHYTAGYSASSAINTLTNPGSRASAHIVVDYDGTITQLAPFNIKTWHAGPSAHMGYSGLNNHSIGIEIVNIGWLRPLSNGALQDAYGNIRQMTDFPQGLVEAPHSRVGGGSFFWPLYPEEQLKAVEALTDALTDEYNIIDIVSHEEIDTRGWKTDPGPAFPMNRMKRHLATQSRGNDVDLYEVTANSLNVRSGPGSQYNVLEQIKTGHQVSILAQHGDWGRISVDGWVHTGYLRRI